MMRIKDKNNVVATVDDETGVALVEQGGWVEVTPAEPPAERPTERPTERPAKKK